MQKLNHEDLLFRFDINSLYPIVMSLMNSTHHKIETSFVFIEDMNDQLVKNFTVKVFGKKTTKKLTAGSKSIKIKNY